MIDRRLHAFVLVRARKRWPALVYVPDGLLRAALKPTTQRLRRDLTLAAGAGTAVTTVVAGVLL